ncbi:hypothetical protein OBBRIDRAFT_830202 [Obba rivulosa]|uniref:F-box domain-containing protein n=1 Tax=Obba rivulosa TaxID=1052685 RepID=A0A8E2DVB6_9APHY|nr:hypothetical protein OBBRIDRAFT_830202 [Obba rivulosa]
MATRMPAELLMIIFNDVKDRGQVHLLRPTNNWIWVTHVCRYWRAVALACGELWFTIHVRPDVPAHLGLLRASLARAGNKSVSIHVAELAFSEEFKRDFVEIIAPHWERLAILGIQSPAATSIHPGLTFPMPKLEWLDLRGSETLKFDEPSFVPFEGQFPELEYLHLERVYYPWKWPADVFGYVTLLRLWDYAHGPLPAMTELLEMLAACDSAEKVDLSQCLPIATDVVPGAHPQPRERFLPSLKEICLSDSVARVTNFLAHVQFDPATHVRLQLKYGHRRGEEEADDPHLAQVAVSRALQRRTREPARHEELVFPCVRVIVNGEDFQEGWMAIIRCHPSCHLHCGESCKDDDMPLIVEIDAYMPFEDSEVDGSTFRVLFIRSMLGVASTRPQCMHIMLSKGQDDAIESVAWIEILRAFAHLTRLEITGEAFEKLLLALWVCPERPALCPNLRHLTVEMHSVRGETIHALRNCVASRAAFGMKLDSFTLKVPAEGPRDGHPVALLAIAQHFAYVAERFQCLSFIPERWEPLPESMAEEEGELFCATLLFRRCDDLTPITQSAI